jgi:large subunit ribosomal protein L9
MKIILKEDVSNLGDMGSVVTVADGYARNYLLPKNLAVAANPKNIKVLDHERRIIAERIKKLKVTAQDTAAKLSAVSLEIQAKAGEEGKLFGSVTTKDIHEALAARGVSIDKRRIILEHPIKRTGEHEVKIRVHPEVTAAVKINVTAEHKAENKAEHKAEHKAE